MEKEQLAFVLIVGSGLMSPLGAVLATCAPTQQVRLIPIALGFSVGVLVWVALVALHPESLEFFEEALHDKNPDYPRYLPRLYVMMSVGVGMMIGMTLDKIVHCLGFEHHHNHRQSMAAFDKFTSFDFDAEQGGSELQVLAHTDHHHHHHQHQSNKSHHHHHHQNSNHRHPHNNNNKNKSTKRQSQLKSNNGGNHDNHFDTHLKTPMSSLAKAQSSSSYEPPSTSHSMAEDSAYASHGYVDNQDNNNNNNGDGNDNGNGNGNGNGIGNGDDTYQAPTTALTKSSPNPPSPKKVMSPHREFKSAYGTHDSNSYLLMSDEPAQLTHAQSRRLLRVGCITSLAVIAHNFPEGLATYTSTVSDPNLGALVAIAVALHNIPLGITVAMPIYLSQGAKCKAILFASLAGLSSLVGGVVGWFLYATTEEGIGNVMNGALFGSVIGIMVWTAFKELLPQAREHDPDDRYTSWLIFAGFLVMDISLVIFDSQDVEH